MKRDIRREMLKIRGEISPDIRAVKDSIIQAKVFSLPEFIAAAAILFYASFRSEVETLSMIKESLRLGKTAVLPKVDRERHVLVLYEIKDMGELTPGYMDIPEPLPQNERLKRIDDVDLVIIPGAGFDPSGNRLGYGAGYYDILLAVRKRKMPVVAPAYDEQIVDAIPAEEHDVRVDIIITDKEEIRIS